MHFIKRISYRPNIWIMRKSFPLPFEWIASIFICFWLKKNSNAGIYPSFAASTTMCMHARVYVSLSFFLFFFGYGLFVQPFPILECMRLYLYVWVYDVLWDFTISEVSKLLTMYQTTITIGLLLWPLTGKMGTHAYLCSWKFSYFFCYSIPFHMNTLFTNTEKTLHSYIECNFIKLNLTL